MDASKFALLSAAAGVGVGGKGDAVRSAAAGVAGVPGLSSARVKRKVKEKGTVNARPHGE